FWPIFSGVIVVEAQKRLYQGVPVVQRASRRVFVPVFSPHGATRLGRISPTGDAPSSGRR
ncbi:MAG: SAM-dependent methyltransferase, partial [Mesorhizobium sp.]